MAVTLPEPHIIDRDPAAIFAEILALFEAETEHTISPDMPEYKFLQAMAQRETELRIAIREAAKQNLRRYAQYPMIDLLAELVGVTRLPASPSLVPLRFTRTGATGAPLVIPVGTRVRSQDGKATFATVVEETIPADSAFLDVSARCTSPGVLGNGYIAGKISELVDGGLAVTVVNVATSGGGAPQESSDALRDRIPEAVHAYATCGSVSAYRYHARAAHAAVVAVHVMSPEPGTVRVVVLPAVDVPVEALLDVVEAHLNNEDLRPITDIIEVVAATPISYEVEATVYLDPDEYDVVPDDLFETTATEIEQALLARATALRNRLGADITMSRLIGAMQRPGVHTALVAEPSASVAVAADEYAECASISVDVPGWWEE